MILERVGFAEPHQEPFERQDTLKEWFKLSRRQAWDSELPPIAFRARRSVRI
jgi:hypothetical protein